MSFCIHDFNNNRLQLRIYVFIVCEILKLFSYVCTYLLCVKYWNCSVTCVRIYCAWNIDIVQLRMYAFIMRKILKLFRIYLTYLMKQLWISISYIQYHLSQLFIFPKLFIFYVNLSLFCLDCICRSLLSNFKVFYELW